MRRQFCGTFSQQRCNIVFNGRFRGRRGRSDSGSFTLSLTVLLAGFLALTIVLHQVSALRIYQVELAEAVALQVEGSLARYDRELVQRYGLWGLRDDALSDHIFLNCTELSHRQESMFLPHIESELEQFLTKPLADPAISAKQIKPYMQLRAPFSLLQEYYQRFQQYRNEIEESVEKNKVQIESDYLAFERERGRIETLLTESDSEEAKAALAVFQEALRADRDDTDLGSGNAERYLHEAMEGLSNIENFAKLPAIPLYDQLLVNEYIMGHFSYATSRYGIPENEKKTWGGWRKKDLHVQNSYEIESIAWQDLSGDSALHKTKMTILGVRLVQHFAAIQTDPIRRAKFQTWAKVIQYAVLFLTAGTVYLPEEILTNAFILIRSAYLAYKDSKILLNGESVFLVPGETSFPIYYHDFLRLLLCFSSEQNKIRHSIHWIEVNLGDEFYTGVRAVVYCSARPWKGGRIEQEASYAVDKK